MLVNYLRIAIRNLLRNKGFTIINIAGLAVGIACFITLALFILDERGYDKYNENADQIYRVYVSSKIGGQESNSSKTPGPLGATLVKDFPEVLNYSRIGYFGQHNLRNGEKTFRENGIYTADSTYFQIFTLPFIYGDSQRALIKPNSVVLSEKTSKKYFGEENPVGKTLIVDGTGSYQVTGVMKDYPKKSHFSCNILLSMSTYPVTQAQSWLDLWYTTYIVLKKGTDPGQFQDKLKATVLNYTVPQIEKVLGVSINDLLANRKNNYAYMIQPLTSIHLYSKRGYGIDPNTEWGDVRNSDIVYTYIFAAIAVFILLIAVFNFMNLATARSEKRAKEVGIRKTLGSSKIKLVGQFMTESVLITFLSVIISLGFLQAALPLFGNFVGKDLKLDLIGSPYTIPALILFTLTVGMMAGSYPAFYLSSFQPAHILKSKSSRFKGNLSVRSLLVVIQFAISITLIIGTTIIQKQLKYIQNKDLGFDKEQLISINNASVLGNKIDAFKQEISNQPGVISSTTSSLMFQSGIPGSGYLYNKRKGTDVIGCQFLDVDYDFVKTFKIKMKDGRFFSKDFSTDSNAVVINEETAKSFNAKDPVGKELARVDVFNGNIIYHIVGVVKDFNYESLHQTVRPLVFHLSPVRQASTLLTIRAKSNDMPGLIKSLEKTWRSFAGNEKFNCTFVDQNLARMYQAEEKIGTMATVFSFLAIFIACLGLLGLAAFVTEQRIKEIGIRKVLGASVMEITALLSGEFTKWVILANILAWPTAYFVMDSWLQNFAYRINIGWSVFIFSGLAALMIAIATVSTQAVKAALANPINNLRYE
jgi:putative ABC transport system permease protein